MNLSNSGWPWHRLLLMTASVAGTFWYLFVATGWSGVEAVRVLVGLAGLWLPFGALIFLLVRDAFASQLACFTFSAIASYTLTTLVSFCFAVADLRLPGFGGLFYVTQGAALAGALVWGWRRGLPAAIRGVPAALAAIDWALVALLVAGSLVTVRYKTAFACDQRDRAHYLVSDGDQTYYTAIAYELDRGTPPRQQATRAGVPDRAYHLFPHLTTMLVARFTGQPDMLRAHLICEYTVLEVLLSLALFCISRILTGSRTAGLIALALLFLGAVPLPRLEQDGASDFFYFTIWPHATSNIEPVLITSPQMYSGLLVTYGIFLGIAALCNPSPPTPLPRGERGERAPSPPTPLPQRGGRAGLLLVGAAMVGAMLRFRIQIFLPLLPSFLVALLILARRGQRGACFGAAGLCLVIAAGLILEMRQSVYLPNSSVLKIGYTGLVVRHEFLTSWPCGSYYLGYLAQMLGAWPRVLAWTRQITSLAMFVLANMIGLPLLVACVFYLRERRPWREMAPLTWLILLLVLGSLAGANCLGASYDSWSVGGQMVLHTGWYLFPWLGAGLLALGRCLPETWRARPRLWAAAAAVLAVGAFVWQCVRPPSLLEEKRRSQQCKITEDDWDALQYIRSTLPVDGVILSTNNHGPCRTAVFSGVSGRRVYLEYPSGSLGNWPDVTDSDAYRIEHIQELWASTSENEFRRRLPRGVTHLVEYAWRPLGARPAACLKQLWVSPHHEVVIWEVLP